MKTPPRPNRSPLPRRLLFAGAAALLLSGCVKPSGTEAQGPEATEGTVSLHVSGD